MYTKRTRRTHTHMQLALINSSNINGTQSVTHTVANMLAHTHTTFSHRAAAA